VVIRNRTVQIQPGLAGEPGVHVAGDSEAWLGFVNGERHLLWALLRRQIHITGDPRLLRAFRRCFA
jgi:SCP-2 sterol transfer family protein